MNDVRGLVQAALAAVNQGRWNEAEQIWHQVLAIDPRHPQALYSVGVHAFKRGQLSEALQALQAAHAAAPQDPVVLLSVAAVLREQGDRVAELKAIEACLAADPYFLPGLLAKATHLEQHGQRKDAAVVYGNALKVAPAQAQWPAALRPQLQHAHELVQTIGTEMAAYLAQQTGTRMAALPPSEAERWREAGALLSGQTEVYPSKCARV
ncbi:MAG: tetratricopeptide repeat protein, partial [Xanthomonadales bacterium]|nr:tetratricopeptide repeat protein [Xanthomonadales bacterium]